MHIFKTPSCILRPWLPLGVLAIVGLGGACGAPIIVDRVEARNNSPAEDSLHTYASNSSMQFEVYAGGLFVDAEDYQVIVSGNAELSGDVEGGAIVNSIVFDVRFGDAGEASITINNASGGLVVSRVVTIVDPDGIELSLPVPPDFTDELVLPEFQATSIRIIENRSVGFRASLFRGTEEIFGTHAVTGPDDDQVQVESGKTCSVDECSAERSAVRFNLKQGNSDAFTVQLAAGEATLQTTLIPTDLDEVTDISISRSQIALEDDDRTRNSALVVSLVAEDPVFGVPVTWAYDGADLLGDDGAAYRGDLASFYENPELQPAPLVATVADRSVSVDVRTTLADITISSVTATCSSSGLSLWALAALVGLARRRRRAQ